MGKGYFEDQRQQNPRRGMVLQSRGTVSGSGATWPGTAPSDFVPDRIDIACTARRMKENVFIEGTIATAVDVPCVAAWR